MRITSCAFFEMLAFNSAEKRYIQDLEECLNENVLQAEEKHREIIIYKANKKTAGVRMRWTANDELVL